MIAGVPEDNHVLTHVGVPVAETRPWPTWRTPASISDWS